MLTASATGAVRETRDFEVAEEVDDPWSRVVDALVVVFGAFRGNKAVSLALSATWPIELARRYCTNQTMVHQDLTVSVSEGTEIWIRRSYDRVILLHTSMELRCILIDARDLAVVPCWILLHEQPGQWLS
jgi:hypothetical protein